MVWNALAMQYRFGFQASSDHISTHISYAVAVAEEPTRESVLDAFRRRHCYGATDNIVLDVRSGDHIMGDEFRAEGPVRIKVHAIGTRPIARVDVIKDFIYVFSTEPSGAEVRVRVDRRGAAAAGAELVLCPGPARRRPARLGEPDLGPFRQRPGAVIADAPTLRPKLWWRIGPARRSRAASSIDAIDGRRNPGCRRMPRES